MNAAMRACLRWAADAFVRLPAINLAARCFLTTLFTLFALYVSAADLNTNDSAGTAEVLLQYRETAYTLASWAVTFSPQDNAFPKEPATGNRRVARGAIGFAGAGHETFACIWDYVQGRLYLDLNGNQDLTDDPQGVFSTEVTRFGYYSQTFTNVHLRVKTPSGTTPLCVDLFLYNPQARRLYGNASSRSIWEGKLSVQGRDWQVARVEAGHDIDSPTPAGYLVLRPWEQREKPLHLNDGSLAGFAFPDNLFFNGRAYQVQCTWVDQEGVSKCKLAFHEITAATADLNVAGKFIERLVMVPERATNTVRYTVVLDRPEGLIKVPAGKYPQVSVALASGEMRAHRVGDTRVEIPAGSGPTPVLTAGGPLTNSVSPGRSGRQLALSYQLLGADGGQYTMPQERSSPPRFVISRNGKEIHSGNFEFG